MTDKAHVAGLPDPDVAEEDEAPKRRRRRSSKLKSQLTEFFKFSGTLIGAVDDFDGKVISDNAEDLAEQLYNLSLQNEAVRRALESILTGGAWAGVIGVFGAKIVLPVTVHHDLFPEQVNSRLAGMMDIPVRTRKRKQDDEPDQDGDDLDQNPEDEQSAPKTPVAPFLPPE